MTETTKEQLEKWLRQIEDIDLEFKLASNNFDSSRGSLFDYCAAIANGRGGKLILGVRDKSREAVGTNYAMGTHTKLSHEIWERIRLHVDIEELYYNEKRVLIFHIPKHPPATRIKSGGKNDKYVYPIRRGESFGEMDDQKTREILNEAQPDFTADVVAGSIRDDLLPAAIENLNKKWAKESERKDFLAFDAEKTLKNIGLIAGAGITYSALILVGRQDSIRKYLPDAEIIFEWRNDPKQTHYDFRKNWRDAFVEIDDDIWNVINARNIRIPFQEGFFQREVWGFDEKSIREAVHNAVMHRDYSIKGRSIFIKASPHEFYIESPGGFPPGITLDNILYEKAWRNRSLAEAFEKIGLAERSSQGLDDIFEQSIRDGKGLPDLSKSDAYTVRLSIPAQVKDKDFILYLNRITNERQINLSFVEIYELEQIREQQEIKSPKFKDKFLKLGIIEKIGRTSGAKYILSHKYYASIGKSGTHTRLTGLSREEKKALILKHLQTKGKGNFRQFADAFPQLERSGITNLLMELKREGKIKYTGSRKSGYWEIKT
ncbi:MAG: putative DNA binding domain-containing protein [Candidatus Omnitrophota bacterium]|nr:putative DNA binding domain-containing protein [Candidatus Omnitrophota bacterium]